MPNSDMISDFGIYKSTIFNIFNRHVPIQKVCIRANVSSFMSKELQRAIMKRSRLRNKFLKHRTDTNKKKLQHPKKSL